MANEISVCPDGAPPISKYAIKLIEMEKIFRIFCDTITIYKNRMEVMLDE